MRRERNPHPSSTPESKDGTTIQVQSLEPNDDSSTVPLDAFPISRSTSALFNDDPFSTYVKQIILTPKSLPGPMIGLKVIATLIGAIGGTPYIEAALNAGKNIPALPYIGYFFAVCTVIGYGSGAIWCLNSNVDRLYPKSNEEKELIKDKASYHWLTHIACNLFSLFVVIVPGYTAYKYNSVVWFSYVAAGIAAFIAYNFNVFGFYTLVDVFQPENLKKQFSKAKALCGGEQSTQVSLPTPTEELVATTHLAKIAINQLTPMQIDQLYSEIFEKKITTKQFIEKLESLADGVKLKDYSNKLYLIQIIGLLIPISNTIVTGYLAFGASKLIADTNWFAIPFIAVTATLFFFLNAYVVLGGIRQISQAALDKYAGNPHSDVLAKNFYATNILVGLAAIALAVLSSAQTGYITATTVTYPLNIVVTCIILLANIIFESYILDIILKIPLEHGIASCSSDPFYKKTSLIQHQLSKLQATLGLMSSPSKSTETSQLITDAGKGHPHHVVPQLGVFNDSQKIDEEAQLQALLH